MVPLPAVEGLVVLAGVGVDNGVMTLLVIILLDLIYVVGIPTDLI